MEKAILVAGSKMEDVPRIVGSTELTVAAGSTMVVAACAGENKGECVGENGARDFGLFVFYCFLFFLFFFIICKYY